jgi:hypothetical protein
VELTTDGGSDTTRNQQDSGWEATVATKGVDESYTVSF